MTAGEAMAWSEPQEAFRLGARRRTRAVAVSAAASIDMACCIGDGELTVFRTLDGERVASVPSLEWFSGWEAEHGNRIEQVFAALTNIAPSQLADRRLFDFATLGGDPAVAQDWLMTDADRD